jgi:hypothetical protein
VVFGTPNGNAKSNGNKRRCFNGEMGDYLFCLSDTVTLSKYQYCVWFAT